MSDTIRNENDPIVDPNQAHVPPEAVDGAHDADGTMGRVAGTGSGAIAGGLIGMAAGPVGAAVGAIAGGLLGVAGGNAAHKVGDDHDDVNAHTGSGGDLGKNAGAGAGGISGAIVGAAAGGPVGSVVGAVAGGVLGAAAGDAAKDMGGDPDNPNVVPSTGSTHAGSAPVVGATGTGTGYSAGTVAPVSSLGIGTSGADLTPGNNVPGVQTGGLTTAGSDTRGLSEKAADTLTGDRIDDKTGGVATHSGTSHALGSTGSGMGAADDRLGADVGGHNVVTGTPAQTEAGNTGLATGAVVGGLIGTAVGGPVGAVVGGTVGSLAGGVTGDAAEAAEGGSVTTGSYGSGTDLTPGNNVPGVQTGGINATGSPDTRGVTEKAADTLTGDQTDDKTGRRI